MYASDIDEVGAYQLATIAVAGLCIGLIIGLCILSALWHTRQSWFSQKMLHWLHQEEYNEHRTTKAPL